MKYLESIGFSEFDGPFIETMPQLISAGMSPITIYDWMKKCIELKDSKENLSKINGSLVAILGDGVCFHPSGKFKFVLDAEQLKGLNPQSKFYEGGLILSEEEYKKLEGDEFGKYDGHKFENGEGSIGWQILARDKKLLSEYANCFKEFNKTWGVFNSVNYGPEINFPQLYGIALGWSRDAIGSNGAFAMPLDHSTGWMMGKNIPNGKI